MQLTHLHLKRTLRGEDPAAWSRALADPAWLASAQLLKDEPNSSWVRRATINGRDVVIKGRYLNTRSRWLKSALGYGHGDKHWRGAALLASKKILTAKPIALFWARHNSTPIELLILEYLPGPTLLQWLARSPSRTHTDVRREHAVASAVADQVFDMIQAGLFNRDHKPSNLIVMEMPGCAPTTAVIDCVGLRRFSKEGGPMLASLMIEAIGCGVPPRRALTMRFLWRYWWRAEFVTIESDPTSAEIRTSVRANWRYIASLISAHGDPRPKTNPLAPREGRGGATA